MYRKTTKNRKKVEKKFSLVDFRSKICSDQKKRNPVTLFSVEYVLIYLPKIKFLRG